MRIQYVTFLKLKPLDTIIQQNYRSFYPLEPFCFIQFNMIHPVQHYKKFIRFFKNRLNKFYHLGKCYKFKMYESCFTEKRFKIEEGQIQFPYTYVLNCL